MSRVTTTPSRPNSHRVARREKTKVAAVAMEEKSPRNPATSASVGKLAATVSLKGKTTRKKSVDTKRTASAASLPKLVDRARIGVVVRVDHTEAAASSPS